MMEPGFQCPLTWSLSQPGPRQRLGVPLTQGLCGDCGVQQSGSAPSHTLTLPNVFQKCVPLFKPPSETLGTCVEVAAILKLTSGMRQPMDSLDAIVPPAQGKGRNRVLATASPWCGWCCLSIQLCGATPIITARTKELFLGCVPPPGITNSCRSPPETRPRPGMATEAATCHCSFLVCRILQ